MLDAIIELLPRERFVVESSNGQCHVYWEAEGEGSPRRYLDFAGLDNLGRTIQGARKRLPACGLRVADDWPLGYAPARYRAFRVEPVRPLNDQDRARVIAYLTRAKRPIPPEWHTARTWEAIRLQREIGGPDYDTWPEL